MGIRRLDRVEQNSFGTAAGSCSGYPPVAAFPRIAAAQDDPLASTRKALSPPSAKSEETMPAHVPARPAIPAVIRSQLCSPTGDRRDEKEMFRRQKTARELLKAAPIMFDPASFGGGGGRGGGVLVQDSTYYAELTDIRQMTALSRLRLRP